MHIFRQHAFRKLSRLLVIAILLGNTFAVWASVEAYFASQDMTSSACHMHDIDVSSHSEHGNCCSDSQECISHCEKCIGSIVSNLFHNQDNLLTGFASIDKPVTTNIESPEGITAGLLYRPPITTL